MPLDTPEDISITEVVEEREVRQEIKNIKNGMTGNLRGQAEVADPKMK